MYYPGCPVWGVKVSQPVTAPAVVAARVWENPDLRSAWLPALLSDTVTHRPAKNIAIRRVQYMAREPIEYQLVQGTIYTGPKDPIVTISCSLKYPIDPLTPGFKAGTNWGMANYVQPTGPNTCHIINVGIVDAETFLGGGTIPTAILDNHIATTLFVMTRVKAMAEYVNTLPGCPRAPLPAPQRSSSSSPSQENVDGSDHADGVEDVTMTEANAPGATTEASTTSTTTTSTTTTSPADGGGAAEGDAAGDLDGIDEDGGVFGSMPELDTGGLDYHLAITTLPHPILETVHRSPDYGHVAGFPASLNGVGFVGPPTGNVVLDPSAQGAEFNVTYDAADSILPGDSASNVGGPEVPNQRQSGAVAGAGASAGAGAGAAAAALASNPALGAFYAALAQFRSGGNVDMSVSRPRVVAATLSDPRGVLWGDDDDDDDDENGAAGVGSDGANVNDDGSDRGDSEASAVINNVLEEVKPVVTSTPWGSLAMPNTNPPQLSHNLVVEQESSTGPQTMSWAPRPEPPQRKRGRVSNGSSAPPPAKRQAGSASAVGPSHAGSTDSHNSNSSSGHSMLRDEFVGQVMNAGLAANGRPVMIVSSAEDYPIVAASEQLAMLLAMPLVRLEGLHVRNLHYAFSAGSLQGIARRMFGDAGQGVSNNVLELSPFVDIAGHTVWCLVRARLVSRAALPRLVANDPTGANVNTMLDRDDVFGLRTSEDQDLLVVDVSNEAVVLQGVEFELHADSLDAATVPMARFQGHLSNAVVVGANKEFLADFEWSEESLIGTPLWKLVDPMNEALFTASVSSFAEIPHARRLILSLWVLTEGGTKIGAQFVIYRPDDQDKDELLIAFLTPATVQARLE